MLLPQGIVGQHYLLSTGEGWSSVSSAAGDERGSPEAPEAPDTSAHFTQRGRNLNYLTTSPDIKRPSCNIIKQQSMDQ